MNSFRVIFGQPHRDTGELFIGTKSVLACNVVPLSYTPLSFRRKKKQFPELRQKTSGLPDFFFPAAERWVRWRCLLLRASRDSSFLSYWTTWQPWTASTCSCTFPFTFLRDRTRNVNTAVITTTIMIYTYIRNNYKVLCRAILINFIWSQFWERLVWLGSLSRSWHERQWWSKGERINGK